MKKYYLKLFLGVCLYGCDQRGDFMEQVSKPVSVSFSSISEGFVDTIKVSNVSLKPFSRVMVKLHGNFMRSTLVVGSVPEVSSILIAGDATNSAQLFPGEYAIETFIKGVGTTSININVLDSFGKSAFCSYKVNSFDNYDPFVSFVLVHRNFVSPFEYSVDASSSYDRDFRFGGKIVRYVFEIDGYIIESKNDKVNFVFEGPGKYSIKVSAVDNDGAINSAWAIFTI